VVEGASAIEVTVAGQSQPRSARVVGSGAAADVALLQLGGAGSLPTAAVGDSANVRVADQVVAIRNASDLPWPPAVTRGIVSALDGLSTPAGP
jgi:S1-C subfamily serine protease